MITKRVESFLKLIYIEIDNLFLDKILEIIDEYFNY
jgi:hypothetical protein